MIIAGFTVGLEKRHIRWLLEGAEDAAQTVGVERRQSPEASVQSKSLAILISTEHEFTGIQQFFLL